MARPRISRSRTRSKQRWSSCRPSTARQVASVERAGLFAREARDLARLVAGHVIHTPRVRRRGQGWRSCWWASARTRKRTLRARRRAATSAALCPSARTSPRQPRVRGASRRGRRASAPQARAQRMPRRPSLRHARRRGGAGGGAQVQRGPRGARHPRAAAPAQARQRAACAGGHFH